MRSGGSSRRGSSPASRGSCATSASPRISRRTRSSPRSSSGRSRASRDNPGRVAHGHREASRDRPSFAGTSGSSGSTRSSATSSRPSSEAAAPDLDAALDDDVGDDLLRLVFTACHPVLSTEARVALTLRLLGGLTTEEIARAFLVSEPTIAQRIVRAKRTLAEKRVPFEVPRGAELAARLSSVLEVIYLDLQRGLLGDRRRRLDAARRCAKTRCASARILAELAPERTRGPRSGRADGDPGVALGRARRPVGRADPAPRSEPRALGSAPHSSRPRRARARRSARRRAGPVRAAGRDRRLPRAGADAGGHRLGAHRGALRSCWPRCRRRPSSS